MNQKISLVLTTINHPTASVVELNNGCANNAIDFIIVGDTKSPSDFTLDGSRYFDINSQLETGYKFARECPTKHYARKNIGYLLATQNGSELIIETDDDNTPRSGFWDLRDRFVKCQLADEAGWNNVYSYFSEDNIWPRGLPLNNVKFGFRPNLRIPGVYDSPIQQSLADLNPDVDAIYRLLFPLPASFMQRDPIALGKHVWCPFNSQNTTIWRDAFPLLYLPYYCSFRMTDIWRSFVAQRIMWENDWFLTFHSATVFQDRNEHDLMLDFADEIPGYLHNNLIKETLEGLPLKSGRRNIPENMVVCYESLVKLELIEKEELNLLDSFLQDMLSAGW